MIVYPLLPPNPILAGTGHRPDAIGSRQRAVRETTRTILKHLQPSEVISGFALGFDIWLADEAVKLGFKLCAAIPFPGQDSRWRTEDRAEYRRLLALAHRVHIVTNKIPRDYRQAADWLMDRNAWMVDEAQGVVACYNKDPTGGTANCVRYARIRHKPLIEFNPYELEQG